MQGICGLAVLQHAWPPPPLQHIPSLRRVVLIASSERGRVKCVLSVELGAIKCPAHAVNGPRIIETATHTTFLGAKLQALGVCGARADLRAPCAEGWVRGVQRVVGANGLSLIR